MEKLPGWHVLSPRRDCASKLLGGSSAPPRGYPYVAGLDPSRGRPVSGRTSFTRYAVVGACPGRQGNLHFLHERKSQTVPTPSCLGHWPPIACENPSTAASFRLSRYASHGSLMAIIGESGSSSLANRLSAKASRTTVSSGAKTLWAMPVVGVCGTWIQCQGVTQMHVRPQANHIGDGLAMVPSIT